MVPALPMVDRSLGPDSAAFGGGPPPWAAERTGNHGLAPDHVPEWAIPHAPAMAAVAQGQAPALRGLDMALSHVTNPTAVAAITAAKTRKATGQGGV